MSESELLGVLGGLYGLPVRETLEPVARVHATRVLRDDRDARCRGVAYVTVSDREEAEHAVRALDGSLLEGHRLRVDFAR